MKKIIFAIYAHPDDESFGPSGTLLLESRAGTQVHLISLTSGDNGMNPDNHTDLGTVRLKEWHAAGKMIGAHDMHYLGYKDGRLDNSSMIEIGEKLTQLVNDIISSEPDDTTIEFMTNDLNGITGHIDHIVAGRIACYVFFQLKQHDSRLSRIRLVCTPRQDVPDENTKWLYMEPGRLPQEVDEVIDATSVHKEIVAIVRAHHTQRSDGENHLRNLGKNIGMNYFIIKE